MVARVGWKGKFEQRCVWRNIYLNQESIRCVEGWSSRGIISKVKAAKASFGWKIEGQVGTAISTYTPTQMNISNVGHDTKQEEREKRRAEDMKNNAFEI